MRDIISHLHWRAQFPTFALYMHYMFATMFALVGHLIHSEVEGGFGWVKSCLNPFKVLVWFYSFRWLYLVFVKDMSVRQANAL